MNNKQLLVFRIVATLAVIVAYVVAAALGLEATWFAIVMVLALVAVLFAPLPVRKAVHKSDGENPGAE